MKVLLELFLFLGIFFPIYHILNALFSYKKKKKYTSCDERNFTIIIPCYNEERIVKTTIDGLLRINYKNYECLFVDDGSTDATLGKLNEVLKLKKADRNKYHNLDSRCISRIYQSTIYPNFFVLTKENGGKSEALNAGINYANNDHIVTLDADSILKEDALSIASAAFDDPDVIAGSGVIQILQAFKLSKDEAKTTLKLKLLLKLQTIEYIKSCFCYKASLAKLNSLMVISGAFGIFKKSILLEVGGFSHTIGEDLDLTLKIQFSAKSMNKKIAYLPNAICYTEGPETFKDYIKQRKRWQASFIESLFTFKQKVFNNAFSKILPFFMVVDALFIGVISSFIILIFFVLMFNNIINSNIESLLIYFIIFISVHLTYNIVGLLLAGYYGIKYKGLDKIRLIFTVILDILIYRTIVLYTIVVGTISYFKDGKAWNKVARSGRNYNVLEKG